MGAVAGAGYGCYGSLGFILVIYVLLVIASRAGLFGAY